MFMLTKCIVVALLAAAGINAQAAGPTSLGRPATEKEIAAWDIDVRADFKGLPRGAGTVQQGQVVWDAKCASCHGTFGESNEVFTPIVGGTTPEDIKTGRVAALRTGTQPQRTTLMKLATVSTLWDYVNRAMPWNAPKSLSTEEVYSVVAYVLHMGEILPADFTLSDKNIAEVQARMPNRNGMVTNHGMWDVKGKPDVKSVACMKDCPVASKVHSSLPDFARNAHGNLALQDRPFGATRGVDTTLPAVAGSVPAAVSVTAGTSASSTSATVTATAAPAKAALTNGAQLAKQNACLACHGVTNKIVGPGFNEIATKYRGDAGAPAALLEKLRKGASGTWGAIPMPPQAHVKQEDLQTIIGWILAGSPK